MTRHETEKSEIVFETADNFPLHGTLIRGAGDGPLALISSAAAVPRGFYARFAEHLVADHGFRATLTYDYRGVAGSQAPPDWRKPLLMRDWAHFDMPAALHQLESVAPGHQTVGIGQSFGGQVLALGGRSQRFARYLMVATMTGYWGNTRPRLRVFSQMNLVGVPLATLLGKVPGRIGLGQTLPGTVFREWAKWGRHPEYFFADPTMDAVRRFAEVETPILAIGLTDDPWGTPKAQHALLKYYYRAPTEIRWISPEEAGGTVGHLGFFRSTFKDTLWKPAVDWLMQR
ncbi:putative alpha/beta hydrolase [Peteryoungia aggregata LMG 23059]|uniref:Alpha/beta hydrolase n=1 Tax=Peteryoungia aggregata LMG 23059 TaxID=1368425 RepID=A0ABU0G8K4_9HYPH|nr:alpha/beta fold hydrolase [Peteryoungia aggregata]MDQ0421433.1 putative alpha/beta hydrolase [Peteryoungia aggregata LMG 23059]